MEGISVSEMGLLSHSLQILLEVLLIGGRREVDICRRWCVCVESASILQLIVTP